MHIPVLNLPSTSSRELWRLRPEFGTALRLALRDQGRGEENGGAGDGDKALLEKLVTISDIRSASSSPLNHLFLKSTTTTTTTTTALPEKISAVLVDHNAVSVPTADVSSSELLTHLNIIACIDHHVDESTIPANASPRIIQTGVGSCTSLVVKHLRDEGFWPGLTISDTGSDEDDALAAVELATLSLASILIDTANLTAQSKVSDTDREVVSFLEGIINSTPTKDKSSEQPSSQATQQTHWDRGVFYDQISATKAESLALLSLSEIFGRDYKSWCEKTSGSNTELNLGIAGVVKPIRWLIDKADSSSAQGLLTAMREYAREQRPKLDLLAIMTTTSPRQGEFQRELLVLSMEGVEDARTAVVKFEEMAREELGLDGWRQSHELVELFDRPDGDWEGRIWWQRDDSKSRKQVAPLLRKAITNV